MLVLKLTVSMANASCLTLTLPSAPGFIFFSASPSPQMPCTVWPWMNTGYCPILALKSSANFAVASPFASG